MPDLVMVPVLSKTMVEIFPATGILGIIWNLASTISVVVAPVSVYPKIIIADYDATSPTGNQP